MAGNVPFLMKDVVLLAVSIYLLKQDIVRVLESGPGFIDNRLQFFELVCYSVPEGDGVYSHRVQAERAMFGEFY